MNNYIYGGGIATGGNQDDYRNQVNWTAVGANKYFYKYSDMAAVGKIENTMIPMLRLGEMYLIATESQSDNLAAGISYLNTLRKYRGISNLQTLNRDMLIYEYIRELYGEGQLFFCTNVYSPGSTTLQHPIKIRSRVMKYLSCLCPIRRRRTD